MPRSVLSIPLLRVAPVLAVLLGGPAPAFALDCAAPRGPRETALCADPASRAAEEALEAALAGLGRSLPPRERPALALNQAAWLANREKACAAEAPGDAVCRTARNSRRALVLTGRPEAGPGLPGRLRPVFLERHDRRGDVSVQLFRFADPATPGETGLNGAVDALLAQVPKAPGGPAERGSYERKAAIAYGSERLLSMVVNGFEFAGGAHGLSTTRVVNLDLRTGRELTFAQLFEGERWGEAARACAADLVRQRSARGGPLGPADRTELDEAVRRRLTTLTAWRFNAADATVLFEEGEAGPRAEGEYGCTLPYDTPRPLAKPDFPLPP